jgi:pyrroloquinoline-quinone synthase
MNIQSSSFMQSFQQVTQNHVLWTHPFLERCRSGNLTLNEVRILAVQMYKFSKQFNRILASIVCSCLDEAAQWVILDNLFDEMGRGDMTQAHPELFRQFTRAIGINDDELERYVTYPETQDLIDTYLSLAHEYGYLSALGAVCFASEGIVHSLYAQLYHGIQGAAPLAPESLIFFEVHLDVDDSHAAKLAALIDPRIQNETQAVDIHRAILEAMDARVQFFDGIQSHLGESQLFPEPFSEPKFTREPKFTYA